MNDQPDERQSFDTVTMTAHVNDRLGCAAIDAAGDQIRQTGIDGLREAKRSWLLVVATEDGPQIYSTYISTLADAMEDEYELNIGVRYALSEMHDKLSAALAEAIGDKLSADEEEDES